MDNKYPKKCMAFHHPLRLRHGVHREVYFPRAEADIYLMKSDRSSRFIGGDDARGQNLSRFAANYLNRKISRPQGCLLLLDRPAYGGIQQK
jgi:hypothetical protein